MKFSLPRSKKSSEVRLSIPGGVLGGSGDVGGERLNSTSSLDNIGICLIGEGGGSKGVEEAERSSSTSVTGVGVRSRSKSNGVGDRRERSTLDLLGVSGGGVSSSSLLLFPSISIISGKDSISSKSSPNTSCSVGGTGISSGSGRGGGGGISSDSGRGGGGG